MLDNFNIKRYMAVILSIVVLSVMVFFNLIQLAQADRPGGSGRAQAQTAGRSSAPQRATAQDGRRATSAQHGNFIDSRYQHNRSYPVRGQFVRTLPRDHRVAIYGHSRYYHANGAWYHRYGRRYAVVAPPFGLFVPFLPLVYTTIWLNGIPYYYANETYYMQTPGGYVVVEPPQGEVSETPPDTTGVSPDITEGKMFVYPRNGQSEEQQATDRYECHKWAVGQTNYDPTIPAAGISADQIMQKRADYQRAMATCLDGRGYTAK